jgi:hypothetical protein
MILKAWLIMLMIVKAHIVELVKNNELKSLFGSTHYILKSAREQLIKDN